MSDSAVKAVSLRSEVGPPRLDELAATIRKHHQIAMESLRRTLESAMACGEALAEARSAVPTGLWQTWLADNVGFSRHTANLYVRLAHFRAELEAAGLDSVSAAQAYLRENRLVLKVHAHPDERRIEVHALQEQGLGPHEVARRTGVPATTVKRWMTTRSRPRLTTTGERPPRAETVPRVPITDPMIERVAEYLVVRYGKEGATVDDAAREEAVGLLGVALGIESADDERARLLSDLRDRPRRGEALDTEDRG